ncbi:hypothetical protein E2976_04315 (plasmid) [Paracoccus yeei]
MDPNLKPRICRGLNIPFRAEEGQTFPTMTAGGMAGSCCERPSRAGRPGCPLRSGGQRRHPRHPLPAGTTGQRGCHRARPPRPPVRRARPRPAGPAPRSPRPGGRFP